MPNILIIDDNVEILDANASHLAGKGYDVTSANTGMKAAAFLNEKQFDCIVMDIMLPDIDGFSLCKAARSVTNAPIIFLTCLDAPDDKVKGLMLGGDDYMTKPYSMKELDARIHAHLRRDQRNVRQISSGGVYIDKVKRVVHTPEQGVFLTQKEFELFMLFYNSPNKVFSKEEILKALWRNNTNINTVAVHVMRLRRKLNFAKQFIGTIENDYNHGYYISKVVIGDGKTI
ncbi:MAG: response regulator transcription factor [Defluviitaleaceae bacterium]|nr:response regulator transcription factor [Defluviitaleaceae bacterium]